MRKFLLSIGVMLFVATGAQAISVTAEPDSLTVTPSTIFVIEFIAHDVGSPGCAGFLLNAAYDTDYVEVVGIENGTWAPWDPPEILPGEAGVVSYESYTLGGASTGSGTVVKVTFHCEGPGVAMIDWELVLYSSTSTLITEQGTVEVVQTPEPTTLAVFGGVLAALGVSFRSHRRKT